MSTLSPNIVVKKTDSPIHPSHHKAVFRSNNLIGDALNISPALAAWRAEHPGWEINIQTLPDHAACLYSRMGVNVKNVFTNEDDVVRHNPYEVAFDFDCGKSFQLGEHLKIHQARAYAQMLGVSLGPPVKEGEYDAAVRPIFKLTAEELNAVPERERGLILVSPFSRSCASREGKPPNKMLPWHVWQPIIRFLRTLGAPLAILGGPDDYAQALDFSADEYLTGRPLLEVAAIMRHARMLVSIDNGMGHLAASQETPTFLFYPACLGMHWIAPWGNRNAVICQLDPATIDAGSIMLVLRRSMEKLEEGYRRQLDVRW